MNDFMPDIDRRSEPLERKLNDLDGAIDARAKPARRGNQDFQRRLIQHSDSHVRLRLQP
jgi:hypothetical protein